MKLGKIFIGFLIAALLSSSVYAAIVVYEDGTQKGTVDKIDFTTNQDVTVSGKTATVTAAGGGAGAFTTISASGNATLSNDIIGDGGDPIVGYLENTITSTTTTLTIAQCGSTIVNDSADVLTLPEASTAIGCRYTFITNNASNFDINPADASDTITLLTNAAGDAIRNATVGNSVTLQAVDATNWSQVGAPVGTWSDIN